jgi:outer membrane protein W
MKTKLVLVLIAMSIATVLASRASGAERPGNYLAFKGGIYSPSATFDIGNIDVSTTFDADTKTGFDGEIAYGHFFLPTFAMEMGIGYFKGTGSFATTPPQAMDFNVIPVIVSAKAFIPAGPIDPYGEVGIGAYFTDFNVSDNLNTFSGNSTFGLHTGAGLNANISPNYFLGVEARYVWANPSFGDQAIRLNDTEYALNGFKLNGFTTTLVLGYNF